MARVRPLLSARAPARPQARADCRAAVRQVNGEPEADKDGVRGVRDRGGVRGFRLRGGGRVAHAAGGGSDFDPGTRGAAAQVRRARERQ